MSFPLMMRPYQVRTIEDSWEKFRGGCKSLLLCSPTGSGKTVMGCKIIDDVVGAGRKVLFLAHRKELITQCSKKLDFCQVPHGVVMAGFKMDSTAPVQVASKDSWNRRNLPFVPDLIITDECHHSAADSYKKIYEAYPNALHLGLTATPFRADGIGLGDVFQDWVLSASIQELITQGYLAPPRYWAPDTPDLKGIGKRGNDFNPEEVAERMKKSHVTGNVVKHYCTHALGKRGIYFAVNKQHSQEMTQAFIDAGIGAAHLDDSTGSREREQILGAHMAGEILIICNVNILSEGYDSPGVEVVGQVRPTLSKGLHLQQLGRGLRIHPGKEMAIILDHAGNVRRHGFAEDEIEVDLSHGLRSRKSDDQEKAPALRTCKKCYAVLPASVEECPSCGSVLGQPPLTIVEKDGSLKEITRPVCPCGSMETVKKAHPGNGSGIFCKKCGQLIKWISKQAAPADFLKEKIKLGKMKGYKESWAFIQFKIRFGNWPSTKEREEAEAA